MFGGQSSSESGRLTVDGAEVVLTPEVPPGPESRALWERVGDSVILDGESEFDFNRDGTPEAGHAQTSADSELAFVRGPGLMEGSG